MSFIYCDHFYKWCDLAFPVEIITPLTFMSTAVIRFSSILANVKYSLSKRRTRFEMDSNTGLLDWQADALITALLPSTLSLLPVRLKGVISFS